MGFLKDNQYFIRNKLNLELRRLSYAEQLIKYDKELKLETRERLRTSYAKIRSNCGDNINFFLEAFEVLASFESEYLLLSIYFNENGSSILNYIFSNKINILFKGIDKHVILPLLINHCEGGNRSIVSFVKRELLKDIGSISNDWDISNTENSSERKLCDFIFQSSKDIAGEKSILRIIYLYTRIWNQYFDKPFNYNKAIYLLHHLTNLYKQIHKAEIKVSLKGIVDRFRNDTDCLLAEFKHSPLTEIIDSNNNYKEGYLIRKSEYDNLLIQFDMFRGLSHWTYINLFILINKSSALISNEVFDQIHQNLDQGILPSRDELREIEWLQLKTDYSGYRLLFFGRCYYFEHLFSSNS